MGAHNSKKHQRVTLVYYVSVTENVRIDTENRSCQIK